MPPLSPCTRCHSRVIPFLQVKGVRKFAESLRTAGRRVQLEVLKGEHVKLLRTDPQVFESTLAEYSSLL